LARSRSRARPFALMLCRVCRLSRRRRLAPRLPRPQTRLPVPSPLSNTRRLSRSTFRRCVSRLQKASCSNAVGGADGSSWEALSLPSFHLLSFGPNSRPLDLDRSPPAPFVSATSLECPSSSVPIRSLSTSASRSCSRRSSAPTCLTRRSRPAKPPRRGRSTSRSMGVHGRPSSANRPTRTITRDLA
jgi:hypothetical protein